MSELRKLSQLRLLCLLKFIILSWRQIHRGCQVVISFAIHDLGVCGLLTGDKLQKVKSKVTKHPKRRPRDVIIHKYKSFVLSSLSSVAPCCWAAQTHTNTHTNIQYLADSRPVAPNSARTPMCLHPLLACTHSALSKVVPERGYLLHTPSCHGAARTAPKNTPLLTGWGPKTCGRPWRRPASLTLVKHTWLEGLNFGHGRDWLVWVPA